MLSGFNAKLLVVAPYRTAMVKSQRGEGVDTLPSRQ